MRDALVLATALVPTSGHAELVRFAGSLLDVASVHVLLSERSFEPVSARDRVAALWELFPDPRFKFAIHRDDAAPQNDDGSVEFWNYWKGVVASSCQGLGDCPFVVASEPYGQELARTLDGVFIPFDLERQVNSARGTVVREGLFEQWAHLLPAVQRKLTTVVTLFGQESVGKTTVSKLVGQMPGACFYPEWARPYLELVGPEVTEEKMAAIVAGQGALQRLAREGRTPLAVQDTDLFSTLGYYEFWSGVVPDGVEFEAVSAASHLYFVMPDHIPVEEDPLRYAGTQRETSKQYWVDLLERFSLPYILVPEASAAVQAQFVYERSRQLFDQRTARLREFVRD